MGIHQANHDIQIVVDQVCLSKSESLYQILINLNFSMHVHSMLWDI